jgi:hypothetical protein
MKSDKDLVRRISELAPEEFERRRQGSFERRHRRPFLAWHLGVR